MTSKNLSLTRLCYYFKNKLSHIILYLVSSLGMGFFLTFVLCGEITEQLPYYKKTSRIFYEEFGSTFSYPMLLVFLLFVCLGFLMGIVDFHYLHSTKKTDFYHSQPESEPSRYFGRVVSSVIPAVIALWLDAGIILIYGFSHFPVDVMFTKFIVIETAIATVGYLAAYSTAVMMTIATNSLAHAVLFTGGATLALPVLKIVLASVANAYLRHGSIDHSIFDFGRSALSPVVALTMICNRKSITDLSHHELLPTGETILLFLCFGISLVFLAIGYLLYKRRTTTPVMPFLAFGWMKHIAKFCLSIAACAIAMLSFFEDERMNSYVVFVILILVTIIVHLLMELFAERTIKTALHVKNMIIPGIALVLFIGWTFLFALDLFHIDTVPTNTNKFQHAQIDYCPTYNGPWHSFYFRTQDINAITEFHKKISKYEKRSFTLVNNWAKSNQGNSDDVFLDISYDDTIYYSYYLTNNKENKEQLDQLRKLDATYNLPYVYGDKNHREDYKYSIEDYNDTELHTFHPNAEFFQALEKDLAKLSYDEVYNCSPYSVVEDTIYEESMDDECEATEEYQFNEETEDETHVFLLSATKGNDVYEYQFGENYTNTLKWFEDHGFIDALDTETPTNK